LDWRYIAEELPSKNWEKCRGKDNRDRTKKKKKKKKPKAATI
jgi:hypothetical protein